MTWVQKIIYLFLNTLAKTVLGIYYRKITVNGTENIPEDASVLVCPNHPNTMLDPVLMANILPFRLFFLANYGLFKTKLTNFLMSDIFFCIPVKREKDMAPGEPVNNLTTIKLCHKKLSDGGSIFMAPEGTSFLYKRIRKLKDGIARIALFAARRNKWNSKVAILPIGTNYEDTTMFRSEVIINIGKPIFIDDYKAEFKKNKEGVSDVVMKDLRARMEALSLHTQDEQEAQMLHWAEALKGPFDRYEERLVYQQETTKTIRFQKNNLPKDFEQLWEKAYEYFETLKQAGISLDYDFSKTEKQVKNKSALYTFNRIFGAPFYFIGRILHWVWYAPYALYLKLKLYAGYESMVKILGGLVLFLLFYPLFLFLLIYFGDPPFIIGTLILLIITAALLQPYERAGRKLKESKRILALENKEQLLEKRKYLLKEFRSRKLI